MNKINYSYYERRIRLYELENTAGENRAEYEIKMLDIYHSLWYDYLIELRHNPNHDPSNGRFCSGGGSSASTPTKKAIAYDSKGNPYQYPTLRLPKKEYGRVIHEINTLYYSKYDGMSKGWLNLNKVAYKFEIHGFDEYNIYKKI